MGISRDNRTKRRATGGKKKHYRKARKFDLGRTPTHTKIGERKVTLVRKRGGTYKMRAIRLDAGNFAWATEALARKSRILGVAYSAVSNELVRTNTLVKSNIIQIDATPFRLWYEQHYGIQLGKSKKEETKTVKDTKTKDSKKDKKDKSKGKDAAKEEKEDKKVVKKVTLSVRKKDKLRRKAELLERRAKRKAAESAEGAEGKEGAKGQKRAKKEEGAKEEDASKEAPKASKKDSKKKDASKEAPKKDAAAKDSKKDAAAKDSKKDAAKDSKKGAAKKDEPRERTKKKPIREKKVSRVAKIRLDKDGNPLPPKKHLSSSVKRQRKALKGRIAPIDPNLAEQFVQGRLYAAIASRPGQDGRADGYILEGKELEFYLKKMQKKKSGGAK